MEKILNKITKVLQVILLAPGILSNILRSGLVL